MGNTNTHTALQETSSSPITRRPGRSSASVSNSPQMTPSSSGSSQHQMEESRPRHLSQSSYIHPRPCRSYSTPVRPRHESCSSHHSLHFSTSLEGGYFDPNDGMHPFSMGGNYKETVPKNYRPQSFDEVHNNKLSMPLDSKLGSGFDLDWQYDPKKLNKVRSVNPDHPCFKKVRSVSESVAGIGA